MVHGNWRLTVFQLNLLFGVVSFFVLLPIVPVYQPLFQVAIFQFGCHPRAEATGIGNEKGRGNLTHPPLLLIPFTTPPP